MGPDVSISTNLCECTNLGTHILQWLFTHRSTNKNRWRLTIHVVCKYVYLESAHFRPTNQAPHFTYVSTHMRIDWSAVQTNIHAGKETLSPTEQVDLLDTPCIVHSQRHKDSMKHWPSCDQGSSVCSLRSRSFGRNSCGMCDHRQVRSRSSMSSNPSSTTKGNSGSRKIS